MGKHLIGAAATIFLITIFRLPCVVSDALVSSKATVSSKKNSLQCTGSIVLSEPSGSFTSPSGSNGYVNDLNCVWRRVVQNDERISLSFESWDLEIGFDFIEVYENGILLGRLEGHSTFNRKYVITGTMEVRFATDGSVVRRGFTANYAEANCGSSVLFTNHNGEHYVPKPLTSPGWPGLYSHNLNCYFTIEVPYGSQIEINIALVDTEQCCDFLEIAEENMDNIRLHEATNLLFTSISNRIQLRFSSDFSVARRGFQASYKQDTQCPPGKWTSFFNRDAPSGGGDSEVLEILHREFPGQICNRPSRIDARLTNFQDYKNSNKLVKIGPSVGLTCDHSRQGSRGRCPDFQVRFCCPPEPRCGGRNRWTRFYNRDSPNGNGDHEGLIVLRSENVGEICESPSSIDVQTTDEKDYRKTGMNVRYSHLWGFDCFNADQASGACPDFQIRFCCPLKN